MCRLISQVCTASGISRSLGGPSLPCLGRRRAHISTFFHDACVLFLSAQTRPSWRAQLELSQRTRTQLRPAQRAPVQTIVAHRTKSRLRRKRACRQRRRARYAVCATPCQGLTGPTLGRAAAALGGAVAAAKTRCGLHLRAGVLTCGVCWLSSAWRSKATALVSEACFDRLVHPGV